MKALDLRALGNDFLDTVARVVQSDRDRLNALLLLVETTAYERAALVADATSRSAGSDSPGEDGDAAYVARGIRALKRRGGA